MAKDPVPTTEGDTPVPVVNPSITTGGDEYSTRGQTTVAAPAGYVFVSANSDLPAITSGGINMTREQADVLIAEGAANGLVLTVVTKEGE